MRGLSTAVVAMILIIVTLSAMLGVFALYSFYFSNTDYTISLQSYLVGLSKVIQVQISTLAFYGISPSYKYFNVSYLIWVSSPTKTVTLVVFNATPTPPSLLSYTLPQGNIESGLFKSKPQGYIGSKSFTINSDVYMPTGDLLGVINAEAYNISSNTTYVLSSIMKPNNVIVIWILYYYQGKWYRLAWTYSAPVNQGLGVYVLMNSGTYNSSNPTNAKPPHYLASQKGMMFGFWFKMLNTQVSSIIANFSFTTVSKNNVDVIVYTKNGGLYVNISEPTVSPTPYTFTILQNLNQGEWYFLNISLGSQVGNVVTIYSDNQKLLNSISINNLQLTSKNGYNVSVKFGSSLATTVISQAFFASLHSKSNPTQGGLTLFYDVSKTVLMNGYYYNNTNDLKQIISVANNKLYDIVYWNFVWPYSNPPPNIPGILWYWSTGGGYPQLYTIYIYPVGQNTYAIE